MGVSKTTLWRRANPKAAQTHREEEKRRWRADPTIKERHARANQAFRLSVKQAVFDAYGGRFCQCCGESEFLFLSLDHVDNDGAAQRRLLGHLGIGHAFYGLLKQLGFPEGYQVLCMNCNFGKRMNGGVCPHQEDWE